MSVASIANRLVATANDMLEEAGIYTRYGIIQDCNPRNREADPELLMGEFDVGQTVNIINCKEDGTVETLYGRVDYYGTDEEGAVYCHAVTNDGRKFRGPTVSGQTRKGTRFDA